MGKYFGTDGFRGEAGIGLTATHAYKIGRFLGWWGRQNGKKMRVAIGKDTRLSCYMLEYAVSAGLVASGADVYLLHVTTTPNVCFTVALEQFDMGVMISASHNPYHDNGIKLIGKNGAKADDAMTDQIERYLEGDLLALGVQDDDLPFATGTDIGKIVDHEAARIRYVQHLVSCVDREFHDFRIGLDCANGAASSIAPAVFTALGALVYPIHTKPNGTNINSKAGALYMESLVQHVRSNGLDVGFAFDGDGDRCIAVDAAGEVVNGDGILYLLAKHLQGRARLAKNTVATTVMSNLGLYKALAESGISYVKTAVGDRFVYECMQQNGFSLGGEQAGHVILSQYATTGDGILTALKIMEVMACESKTLAELVAPVHMLPQVTKNLPVTDKSAVCKSSKVTAAVDVMRERLGDNGRVLLRASGTEPVVRIMVEAISEEICRLAVDEIAAAIKQTGLCLS
ncbi:MAG: phosphoglucosamine mutase [Clostridia bacterium]|nr:phosphoglucosamine mutase [Clostridia bacterium]